MPTKELIGIVKKIKTGKPYPLTRPDGTTWLCKWRFEYVEVEPDGEEEKYIYIAYPTRITSGIPAGCCRDSFVGKKLRIEVEYKTKSPNRGTVNWYKEIDL